MAEIVADNAYHVDLSSDEDFTTFRTIKPESLDFSDAIRGIGNCSWQISLSAKDEDDNLIISYPSDLWPVNRDFLGPYQFYFRLRYGNVEIMTGPIISTKITSGDDFVSIAGKSWEHYFERWQYPFDPRDTPTDSIKHVNDYRHPNVYSNDELIGTGRETPTGLQYQCVNRDLIRILSDILSTTMNAVPNRIIFDIGFLGGLCGVKTNINFSLGDTTYMDKFINGLASTAEGFDWWVTTDRVFHWGFPYRFGDPAYPYSSYTIDVNTPLADGALGYGNNGPGATHVWGRGAGHAAQTQFGRAYGYAPAQQQFTRLDKSYDFGDIRSKEHLVMLTQRQLSRDLQADHDIPLQLDPNLIPNFWSTFRKGRAIYIDYDLGVHHIESYQRLLSYTAKDENSSGNILVDWTLEQIYNLSVNAGSPEG